jgi:YidC/Oxa1 family membrane protein insertase
MDQRRLFAAIAISLAILIAFQFLAPPPAHHPPPGVTPTATAPRPSDTVGVVPQDAGNAPVAPPRQVPRLKIEAARVQGSVSLLGARFDDVVLRDYRETLAPNSPLVRILEPKSDPQPYYVQYGWTASGPHPVPVPGNDTVWTASPDTLRTGSPVTLSWANGQGQTFELTVSIDANYMFGVQQRVRNAGTEPVQVLPWMRLRRDYTPQTAGYSILHEGPIGVLGDQLHEITYRSIRNDADKADAANPGNGGLAQQFSSTGGWAGITDKYWLAALVPDQAQPGTTAFYLTHDTLAGGVQADGYQVDFAPAQPETVVPAGDAMVASRFFAGAKEVHLLDRYQREDHIPNFYLAVDFGHLWFITRPFFFAIDWIYQQVGNFGVAIMIFTLALKLLFFPLANYSYRSMSKMKLLGPKMTELRELYKDEPQKLQGEIMRLYKAEKVNPASGCLPMVIQIPIFFSLYKVIFVTIEMRQAPFFGWIHDLSAVDPTNVFNLFGLIPFDPAGIAPLLHLGAWPLIMGFTMYFQQKLNPPPPDPTQAKLFQFMPIIFTFMLARFPAGLVIYWTWNNLLTIAQQWVIMRQTRLTRPSLARV